jgi:hypothetical protein
MVTRSKQEKEQAQQELTLIMDRLKNVRNDDERKLTENHVMLTSPSELNQSQSSEQVRLADT